MSFGSVPPLFLGRLGADWAYPVDSHHVCREERRRPAGSWGCRRKRGVIVEALDSVSAVIPRSTDELSELIPGAAMFPLWRTRPKIPALPRSIKVRRS